MALGIENCFRGPVSDKDNQGAFQRAGPSVGPRVRVELEDSLVGQKGEQGIVRIAEAISIVLGMTGQHPLA